MCNALVRSWRRRVAPLLVRNLQGCSLQISLRMGPLFVRFASCELEFEFSSRRPGNFSRCDWFEIRCGVVPFRCSSLLAWHSGPRLRPKKNAQANSTLRAVDCNSAAAAGAAASLAHAHLAFVIDTSAPSDLLFVLCGRLGPISVCHSFEPFNRSINLNAVSSLSSAPYKRVHRSKGQLKESVVGRRLLEMAE